MPQYTESHALLRFGGTAWDGLEEWSCGLRLRHGGGDANEPGYEECVATVEAANAAVRGYVSRAPSAVSNNVRHMWTKLNWIDKETGKYYRPDDPVEILDSPLPGGGGPGIPQVALCVTMRGSYQRGLASRGRWFTPAGVVTLESDGQVPHVHSQAVANSAAQFLEELQNIDSGLGPDAWNPFLFGKSSTTSPTPRMSSIIRVEVGRIYDTQRRRREGLTEGHTPNTLHWT